MPLSTASLLRSPRKANRPAQPLVVPTYYCIWSSIVEKAALSVSAFLTSGLLTLADSSVGCHLRGGGYPFGGGRAASCCQRLFSLWESRSEKPLSGAANIDNYVSTTG